MKIGSYEEQVAELEKLEAAPGFNEDHKFAHRSGFWSAVAEIYWREIETLRREVKAKQEEK
jgi:hypothetical protein